MVEGREGRVEKAAGKGPAQVVRQEALGVVPVAAGRNRQVARAETAVGYSEVVGSVEAARAEG